MKLSKIKIKLVLNKDDCNRNATHNQVFESKILESDDTKVIVKSQSSRLMVGKKAPRGMELKVVICGKYINLNKITKINISP